MTERHQVTEAELIHWIKECETEFLTFAASYGQGSKKIMARAMTGVIRVMDHDEIIYEGTDGSAAVCAYNDRD